MPRLLTVMSIAGIALGALGCDSDEGGRPSEGASAAAGMGPSDGGSSSDGGADAGGTSNGGGSAAADGDGGSDASGGSPSGDGGSSTGSGGSGNSTNFYAPPTEFVGGVCADDAVPATDPCPYSPEQIYCKKGEPENVIMAVCSSAGRFLCDVLDTCKPGWHTCTASDYVTRGGRDIPPNFSTTNRAWLAACARDVDGLRLKDEPCTVCDQEVGFDPAVQWWCDGEVVYEGGMAGDTLGVVTAPECMRIGQNSPGYAAYWSMSFSGGSPSFVMCCTDEL